MSCNNFVRQMSTFDKHNNEKIISVYKYSIHNDGSRDLRKIIVEYADEIDIPRKVIEKLLTTTHRNILNVNFHPTEYSKVYSPYIELRLYDLIHINRFLHPKSNTSIQNFVIQLVKGVAWLHQHNIFHGYLNPEDIYLENYYTVKIGGFYFSEILKNKTDLSTRENRLFYYIPTSAELDRPGLKYDIWCLGLVIYEFIFTKSALEFLQANDEEKWENLFMNLQSGIFDSFKNFLKYDYEQRPFVNDNDENITATLECIENCHAQELQKFKESWSFTEIKELTKKLTNKNNSDDIRCLKFRNFNKETHDFERELCIYKDSEINHEKFAALYFADMTFISEPYIWLLTEFAQLGCLKEKIECWKKKGEIVPIEDVVHYAKEMIRILAIMHERGVIHRNLKPSNVLLFEKNNQITLKFTDFYTAKSKITGGEETLIHFTQVANSPYTAPELFDANFEYGKPVDVWSVGCIIHEMMFMSRFYKGLSRPIQLPNNFNVIENPLIKQLCERMIVLNPKDRADADELKNFF